MQAQNLPGGRLCYIDKMRPVHASTTLCAERAAKQSASQIDINAHGAAAQLMEDQDGADTEFWNQEFFAEEGRDDEYATESESEDKADTDFSGSEEDDDEEGGDGAEAKERCV